MRNKNLDLIGAIVLVAMYVGWSQLPGAPLAIGIILALPLIFFLPGYAITQTLFRRQPSPTPDQLILRPSLRLGQPVSVVDHLILGLGLSMALDVLVGFTLNLLPVGLQRLSWMVALGLITVVFALLATLLRSKTPVSREGVTRSVIRLSVYDGILLLLALLVMVGAVWYAVIRPLPSQFSASQFWMLPSSDAANSCAVNLGVRNLESTTIRYNVTITVNGTLQTLPSVTLAPQQEWKQLVPITTGASNSMRVEGQVYQSNQPANTYKKATLTLQLLSGGTNGKAPRCEAA